MKKEYLRYGLISVVIICAFTLVSCGGGGGGGEEAPAAAPAAGPGPGPADSVTLSTGATDIVADGASRARIKAEIVDSGGNPVANGTTVTFTTTAGSFSPLTTTTATTTNGVASVYLTSPTRVGSATITVTVGGVSNSTTVSFIPGAVAFISLTAIPDNLTADGSSTSTIRAVVTDAQGNAVAEGEMISFSVTTGEGTLSAPTAITTGGVATVIYTASTTSGTETISAQATNGIEDSVDISLSGGGIVPDAISLSTSQVTVKSDNSDSATIIATVLDAYNIVVEGATVRFESSGGQLGTSVVDTDASGEAPVTFSSGSIDKSNRTVTITAKVDGLTAQIPVRITGSSITISTDIATIPDDGSTTATLTATAKDAGGIEVYNTTVTLTADVAGKITLTGAEGHALTPVTSTQWIGKTDVFGQTKATVTGIGSGNVKVKAEALGAEDTEEYTVSPSGATFGITAPVEDPKSLHTNTNLTITVENAPSSGNVRFATTLGTLTGTNESGQEIIEPADAAGSALATLISDVAGVAKVQVFDDPYNPTTMDSLTVIISAPFSEAAQIALQASATVLPPSDGDTTNSVELIATVKNDSDQVVGDAPVIFSIENPTGGGESVFPVIEYTDDCGKAESTFTSGSLSTDAEGITVRAGVIDIDIETGTLTLTFADANPDTITRTTDGFVTDGFASDDQIRVQGSTHNDGYYTVAGASALTLTLVAADSLTNESADATITKVITDSIQIVIGGTAGSVVIGQSTKVSSNETGTAYILPMSVLVADSNGNPVPGATVSLSAWPAKYSTGYT